MNRNKPLRELGLLLLRVCASAGMLTHGWPKVQKLMAGDEIKFPDPLGVGNTASLVLTVLGEFAFPILIILGFITRLAAIPPAFAMVIAFFVVHGSDPFGDKEMSFIYMAMFVAIALVGAGKWSIDGMMGSKKSR